MENILKLAGQKDEIFANFGTQIDMKGNKYAPHLRKSCIQAKASGKLGLSLFKFDFREKNIKKQKTQKSPLFSGFF